ncbi:unnamed protein product [Protopolystoma xenopodis]|uniref:Uncharacterized protein n=1 Tax=Protopolystoma xenopodis TaxID=117903 RepID=A0A3S4ZPZ1_9PLAT|nr:unnamed protein product [Protopolystoma xenopodis]
MVVAPVETMFIEDEKWGGRFFQFLSNTHILAGSVRHLTLSVWFSTSADGAQLKRPFKDTGVSGRRIGL